MQLRSALLIVPLLALTGCSQPPTITKGTFTESHTLTIQRGSADVVVKTTGSGSYVISNYAMTHPMGSRPDTEATFTTPAGKFVITDKDVKDGMLINGAPYPTLGAGRGSGRVTVTIDEKGTITVEDPTTKNEPKAEPPKAENPKE